MHETDDWFDLGASLELVLLAYAGCACTLRHELGRARGPFLDVFDPSLWGIDTVFWMAL